MIINIDGMDGTGKTTVAKKLAKELGMKYVHFPTKPFPKNFSELPEDEIYEFFVVDMVEWFNNNPLENLVLDRSIVSTMLYQSDGVSKRRGVSKKEAMQLILDDFNNRLSKRVKIDKVFLFVADVDVALERANKRGKVDKNHENRERQERVKENIPICAKVLSENGIEVEIIDTTEIPIDAVYEVVKKAIEELGR